MSPTSIPTAPEGQVSAEDPLALFKLGEALRAPDPAARIEAARALGALGDPRAVTPLCEALADRSVPVRNAAAEALALIGDERAAAPLMRALQEADAPNPYLGLLQGVLAVPVFIWMLRTGQFAWWAGWTLVFGVLHTLIVRLRREGQFVRVACAALAAIAERSTDMQTLRSAPVSLRSVAASPLKYGRASSRDAWRAANRIQALIKDRSRLPVPSAPAPPAAESLPLASADGPTDGSHP